MENKKLIGFSLVMAFALVIFLAGCKKKTRAEKTKVYASGVIIEKPGEGQPTSEVGLSVGKKGEKGIMKFFDDDAKEFFLEEDGDELRSPKEMAKEISQPLLDLSGEVAPSEPESDELFWSEAPQGDEGFPSIYFGFDKFDVEGEQKKNLETDIESAVKEARNGKEIVVEGHSCHSAGSRTYNLALSNERAKKVASQMRDRGVQNVIVIGRGSDMPLTKGGDRNTQWQNRRVQVLVRSK